MPAFAARLVVIAALGLSCGCARLPARPPDPLSAAEHNDLGVAYYRQGEYEAAEREFARAVGLQPRFLRALVNLGDARLAHGAVDEAIEAYERARGIAPGDPAVLNNLAWALLQHERRWPEAEPLIHEALGQRPEPRGYYLDTLGLLRLRQGAPARALDAFRTALADPGLPPDARRLILGHVGDALARLGDADGAARCRALGRASGSPALVEVGGSDTVC